MKLLISFFILSIFAANTNAQNNVERDINKAFTNAKKGVYYALSNIPENKSRMSGDLIENDQLLAKVKLSKEINGVKIESTGYSSSNEVTIKIYKSLKSLREEGYLKNGDVEDDK
ncbi:MAG TPA: hypothetical protein VJ954_07890 [Ignavibacteriaceae bacterium]|nr:hypothetical protein [Ignavibacteriaceae bacterium]